MSEKKATGGCFCGAVRYEVTLPQRFVAHCHCESCRRSVGVAFVTWAGFVYDQFRLLQGEETLRRFASSPPVSRSFCGKCGTALFFENSEKWAGELHITRATFDTDLKTETIAHSFHEEQPTWSR